MMKLTPPPGAVVIKKILGSLRGVHPIVRGLSALSAFIGFAFLLLGFRVQAEIYNFSASPLLANLWSGVSLSLIGVPFAAIFTAELTSKANAYRSRIALQTLLRNLTAGIEAQAGALTRVGRTERDLDAAELKMGLVGDPNEDGGEDWFKRSSDLWNLWESELRSPPEVAVGVRQIQADWFTLKSLREEVLRTGWKWTSIDIERRFSEGLDLADAVFAFRMDNTTVRQGYRLETDKKVEMMHCMAGIRIMLEVAEHLRNTFLFGDAPPVGRG